MTGSKLYKISTSSPIANLGIYFTETILGDEYVGKIGDYILEMQTGKTPPMNVPKYYSSNDIDWAKPSDIGKGKYLVDLPDKLSQVAVDENKVTLYKPGTLLIICIGAGVGRVALTNNLISSNQQITGILFNKKVYPEYAYYYFFCREAIFKQKASQTTLPIINQKGLKDLDFRCPDKDLQKTFLNYVHYCEECLSKEELPLDRSFDLPDILFDTTKKYFVAYYAQNNILKELDQQQIYLQQLRQTILQEAVQGKLTKQNPQDEPATALLKRIKAEKEKLIKAGKLKKEKELLSITKDEIPFELPEGWVWCRLGEVIEFSDNLNIETKLSMDTLINYVDIDAIDNQRFVIREAKQKKVSELSSRARRVLKKGYIVYSLVRPYLNNIAIVEDTKANYIGSTGFAVFNGIMVDNYYLKFILLSEYVRARYLETLKGFNSPSITQEQFTSTLIPLAPLAEQQRIVTKVQRLQQQLNHLETQVQQSRNYAQQLLQSVLKEAFENKPKEYKQNETLTLAAEE